MQIPSYRPCGTQVGSWPGLYVRNWRYGTGDSLVQGRSYGPLVWDNNSESS